jgi:PAS domain S-box-containing protein
VLDRRQQLLAGQIESYSLDYRVRRSGGGWVPLRGRVAVSETDPNGKPLWVCGILQDVSREHEFERRLHAVFDRPFQFIGLLTPAGVLLETNRSSLRESGHKVEDVLGKPLWESPFFARTAAQEQQLRQGIAQAAQGQLVRFEMCNPDASGARRTTDFTLTPLRDDDGEIVNIIPEGRDISDLVQVREALFEAEQRLSMATQAANIGLWDWRLQGGEAWYSDQWWTMLGFDPGELPATVATYQTLLHPDDRARVVAMHAEHQAGGKQEFEVDFRMRCKDGSWRWIQSKGCTVERAADGTSTRVTGVHIDITQRKEAEARLASAERLESIGRLAAGVAHEINTPVQYVNDSLYFIRESVQELLGHFAPRSNDMPVSSARASDLVYLQENLPFALDRALEGLARVADIVRSMKEFSHADQAGKEPVDLNRAIQSTLVVANSEYRYVAEIHTELSDLPPIVCHGAQINQVVLNLLVNAAHAIADKLRDDAPKGLITIKTFTDGPEVVIAVSDTGGGIPEAIQHRIFDPFFTTKDVGRGTGQGLSLARNIVINGHGGSISFQTQLGTGTTFFVRLPIEPASDQAQVA